MTQPAPTQSQQSWNTSDVGSAPQAPAPTQVLESARQFRDAFGGRSRQWIHRKLKSDPDFPRPIYIGPRMFFDRADRLEYVRILKERSAAKAAAKAARELADAIDTGND